MKENIIITYEYKELSEEIKERIIESLADINVGYQWFDCTINDQQAELKTYGISDTEILFSGFYSQGDGLSFTGSIDLLTLIEKTGLSEEYPRFYQLLKDQEIDATAYIERKSYQYVHSHSVRLTIEYDQYYNDLYAEDEDLFNQAYQIEYALDEWRQDICHKYYKQLEKEYEYLISHEAIEETIEANEYQFTAEGKIF